jgi:hypothetical protein
MVDRWSWRVNRAHLRSLVHRSVDWLVRIGAGSACCNISIPVLWAPEAMPIIWVPQDVNGRWPTGGAHDVVSLTPAEQAAWVRLLGELSAQCRGH